MKSLSIQQPWADLIGQGLKPYEIRSWQTTYRGPLLICSSAKVSPLFKADNKRREGEKIYTFDPADPDFHGYLHYGKALFVCELSHIEPFAPHHAEGAWVKHEPGFFAWHLTNIKHIQPFDVKGKLNFFETDEKNIIYL